MSERGQRQEGGRRWSARRSDDFSLPCSCSTSGSETSPQRPLPLPQLSTQSLPTVFLAARLLIVPYPSLELNVIPPSSPLPPISFCLLLHSSLLSTSHMTYLMASHPPRQSAHHATTTAHPSAFPPLRPRQRTTSTARLAPFAYGLARRRNRVMGVGVEEMKP